MLFLNTLIFIIAGSWLLIGLVIYYFYGSKNAKY
jgi:hypothetical protein